MLQFNHILSFLSVNEAHRYYCTQNLILEPVFLLYKLPRQDHLPTALTTKAGKQSENQEKIYHVAHHLSSEPMDCSPPGSSVHGILQARILEWIAIPFSKGSSALRNQTQVFCISGRFFTV